MKRRSFAVRRVNTWNSIPVEAVASDNVETFNAQLDRFLGIDYMIIHNTIEEKTLVVSHLKRRNPYCKCANNL